jgi:hypothetical protein
MFVKDLQRWTVITIPTSKTMTTVVFPDVDKVINTTSHLSQNNDSITIETLIATNS